jgi:seryl-tRNA synthetase
MKAMIKDINKPASAKISLDETLERSSKQKSKIITISDLQHEIINIKREIVSLKSDLQTVKIDNNDLKQQLLFLNLQNCFHDKNSDNEENDKKFEQSVEVESSNKEIPDTVKIIRLIDKVIPPNGTPK